jgi:pimeloyl-ACP methyl ester carboxylesterase
MNSADRGIKTADHHRIALNHLRTGHDEAIILAHGFYNNKDAYLFLKMAEEFSRHFDVISFDFRGHGKSSGLFSWTSNECADLKAIIDYAKNHPYKEIGLVGFSLGAAIGLIEAAQNPDVKTVIAVSAPYDFWKIDFCFWKRGMLDDLRLNVGMKGKGKFIRPGNPFLKKVRPVDIVGKLAPRPVLFLHGSEDWLIHSKHSEILYKNAKEPKRLILLEKLGHAETMFDQRPDLFMKTCIDWFNENLKGEVKV